MLPQRSHIARKRGGIYYWRRRWPGRRGEAAFSLGTRAYREAEHLAAVADEAFEREWVDVERSPPHLVDPTPLGASPMDDPAARARAAAAALAAVRAELATVHMIRRAAREAAERAGVQPRTPEGKAMTRMAFQAAAMASGSKSFEVGAVGKPPPVVVAPQMPVAPPPRPPKPPPRFASSFVEEHFAARAEEGARQQVMNQDRTTLRLFFEMCGDRPFAAYGRGDVSKFLGALRKLPVLHGKSPHYRGRMLEIIAEADRRGDKRRLREGTVQRHFSALTQFFMLGVDHEEGQITNTERFNLLDGFTFRLEKGASRQREEWPVADLIILFTSPLYTGCRRARRWMRGKEIIRDARFWIPLLALFHGARVEEFCDLYRRDIRQDEGGTWFMDIREWEDEEGGDRRTLKTHAAERKVPIHPELLRMGFLDCVERRAPRGDDPVFPDLPRQGADGKRGPAFTRWFGRYRKAIGVFREGVAAHSFRHNAETRLNAARADARHVDYLMGHEPVGSEGRRRYDKGPSPSESIHNLALLAFPELDFSILYVA